MEAASDWVRTLLGEHEHALLAYTRRITGDLELARDVVQEAFLRLLRADKSEVEGHARRWLYRVCRNRALDVTRKEFPMQTFDPAVEDQLRAAPGGDPAGAAQRAEQAGEIHASLALLPDAQREVLELRFGHGLSYREISAVTEHSIGHVGWLIHHGIRALRTRLARGDERASTAEGLA